MKKFAKLFLSAVLAFTCAGCAAKVAPSFAMPPSWIPGGAIYEQASYRLDRYSVTSAEDRLNPTGTSVAGGSMSVTIRTCTDSAYPECLELITESEQTFTVQSYAPGGVVAEVGDRTVVRSKVIFSIGTSSVMETRYAEKKIVSDADPSVNLDYTAVYGGGLKITSYALDEQGERVQKADGGFDTTTYSFKSKQVGSHMFDNDMWMLLNRYGSDFKAGWTGSYTLVSVPDIIYNDGKLSTFTVSATASEAVQRNLNAMKENIVLSKDDVFANVDQNGNFSADCTDVSIVNSGSMNVNYGPVIYASYITSRSVERVPLANLLVQYAQNEFSNNGTLLYATVARLTTAAVTEA